MEENAVSTNAVDKTPNVDVSATNPSVSPKKGGKGLKFFVIGCVVLGCCVIGGLVAGVVYAMKSNRNIPLISDVADAVENVAVSEDKQAEMVQEDMVNTVFSALLPVVEDKENNAFFKANFTKKELESMISKKKELNSVRYEINFDYSAEKSGSFVLNASGFTKKRDDTYKYDGQMSFDGKFKVSGMELSAEGEMKQINDAYYVKLSKLPAMAEAYGELKDKWIKLDTKELTGLAEQNDANMQNKELTKEDLEKIKTLIESEEVKKTIERVDSEVIKGVRTNCFKMDLNKDNFSAILNKANDIFDTKQEKVYAEDLKELEYLKVVMCSDKKNQNLYKLTLETKITLDDGNNETMLLKLDMKLWDYDKVNDKVEEPKDAVNFEELMQKMMSGSMYQEGYNNSYDNMDYGLDEEYDFGEDYNWNF